MLSKTWFALVYALTLLITATGRQHGARLSGKAMYFVLSYATCVIISKYCGSSIQLYTLALNRGRRQTRLKGTIWLSALTVHFKIVSTLPIKSITCFYFRQLGPYGKENIQKLTNYRIVRHVLELTTTNEQYKHAYVHTHTN